MKLSYDLQKRYRSGVGSLLYILKHSRPELSNAVRELSKYMDKANMINCKAILGAIIYLIDKNNIDTR